MQKRHDKNNRVDSMKRLRLLSITLILSIGLYSCSDSILNHPTSDNNIADNSFEYSNSFQKENPENRNFDYRNNRAVSKIINGSIGGVIQLHAIYNENVYAMYKGKHSGSKIVNVSATLIIPPGAFEGVREITLIDDYKTASLYCYPSMTFDKTIYLNLTFIGLDLDDFGFTNDDIKFGYIRADGTNDPCVTDGIFLNPWHGAVGVVRAQIHHFSRYAFCR